MAGRPGCSHTSWNRPSTGAPLYGRGIVLMILRCRAWLCPPVCSSTTPPPYWANR
ncbi:hypothetical protein T06_3380, partial [Trichinella sp. T6]